MISNKLALEPQKGGVGGRGGGGGGRKYKWQTWVGERDHGKVWYREIHKEIYTKFSKSKNLNNVENENYI